MDDIWAYRVSRGGDTSVVTLSGEVDMNAEDELADVLLGEIRRPGTRTVQVDLEGVEFLDSSAINVLVRAYNEACETGRRLRVAGAHQTPLKVLEMTGLMPLLALDDPVADAGAQ
jgi:stage II sporulation protein AA (anti-sigma F factor antagonist)